MGPGFLAPLFFAGAALIVVPWIVHRIRRPEREVVRFSSLMFVPEVKVEVIERRRVQHLLLMLLRMFLLLLAIAFTRPFWAALAAPEGPEHDSAHHVILLDTSLSMATVGYMGEAKVRAHAILDGLSGKDRAAVVRFSRTASVDAPLFDPENEAVGSTAFARRAIDAVQASWETTDYAAGLQAAERLLLDRDVPSEASLVVHLISDFQEAGMPDVSSGWRLSSRVAFEPVVIGGGDGANAAVQALAVREAGENELQVRARIKNWSQENRSARVALVAGDRVVDTRDLTVLGGNASQVVFTVPWDGGRVLEGYVEVGEDALAGDNRRYFAWNSRRRDRVLLVRDGDRNAAWPFDRLIEAAVPEAAGLPWKLVPVSVDALQASLERVGTPPEIVIAGGLNGMSDGLELRLKTYVRSGGRLFLPLSAEADVDGLNRLLDDPAGIRIGGDRFEATREGTFERLSWVNLEHRIFRPFRGARFNDFSSLRFYNYHRLNLAVGGRETDAVVLARFEGTEPGGAFPAMVDVPFGEGRVLIWAGGLEPGRSNLAKRSRFVPLLHETLRYLSGERPDVSTYTVGDAMTLPMRTRKAPGPWEVEHETIHGESGRVALDEQVAGGKRLEAPGVYRWRGASQDAWERVEAVNVDAGESDPTRISVSEFEIKLCDAPVLLRDAGPEEGVLRADAEDRVAREEYGLVVVGCLLGFLFLESWYAARLGPRVARES